MKKIISIILLTLSGQLAAQQVLIDHGTRVHGLWCFPLYNDTNTYLYLPARARLALDEKQKPKFSFMRYITEKQNVTASINTVTEAGGGGILHFLILYDTPEEQVKKAEIELRRKLKNKEISIRGPIVFDKGRYTLISSILNRENDKEEKRVLSIGEAPVLENSKMALSFDISPLNSELLLESFKMDTPDISFIFELTFSGLSNSYDATLEIDWSEVRKSKSFSAGGSAYFIGADVKTGFDELMKNKTIRLTTNGSHETMETLLNNAYDKLLKVMFTPVKPKSIPKKQQGGIMDALTKLVSSDGALNSRNITGFGFNTSFELKKMKTKGTSKLFFKGRSTVSRTHFVTFNIGGLYQQYGQDKRFFKDIYLWDSAFQQREVYVGIDGNLEKEFEDMINSVTVTLRKKHGNGKETLVDILIKKESLKSYDGSFAMRYLNQGDTAHADWLKYEYKTNWKFKGGGSYETPWKSENASMINLFVPFQRRTIHLEGDLSSFKTQNIRAVSVQISYPFFDHVKQHRHTIRPTDKLEEKKFEITLPNTIENVNYTITWITKNAVSQKLEGTDKFGVIFIDEIPEKQ